MSPALHTVHIRCQRCRTGQPTPARLRITDGDGTYYAPFGRLTEFATEPNLDVGGNLMLGDKAYAYIDGSAEIQLPSGNLYVESSKGPEYRPVHAPGVLGVGKMALRFTTERGIDPSAKGWYAGDTRCHCLPPTPPFWKRRPRIWQS